MSSPSSSKTALITGGASGIGFALAESLARAGWNIAIVDLSISNGSRVVKTLGSKAIFIEGNVVSYSEQAKAFAKTWETWGRLDLVVANAGIVDRTDFYKTWKDAGDFVPPEPDTLVIDVDLKGVIWSSYLALHFFRKNATRGGKLVMTASSAGLYPMPEAPLYSAAKHAIVGLTRSLAKRLEDLDEPITVNAICPGLVPTAINSEALVAAVPPRMITPLEVVVRAVERVILDSSISGQTLECSGQQIEARSVLPYLNEAAQYTAGGEYKKDFDIKVLTSHWADAMQEVAPKE